MFTSKRITTMGGDKFRDDRSLAFDGSDDYVRMSSDVFTDATTYTVGCWIKYLAEDTYDWLFGTDATTKNFGLNRTSDHIFYREENGEYFSFGDNSNIPLNKWTHLVFTSNASKIDCYINGALLGTITVDSTTEIGGSNTLDETKFIFRNFGAGYETGGTFNYHVNCNLSDVFAYDSYITASQIKTLYNGREPYNHKEGVASGSLKGWWRMGDGTEQGSGTTIYDMSGEGKNGTMTNMAADDFVGDIP